MKQFTIETTNGYSVAELDYLNGLFESELPGTISRNPNIDIEQLEKSLSEKILTDYDSNLYPKNHGDFSK